MKKYKNLTEWRKYKPNEYATAVRKGWLDEIRNVNGWGGVHKPNGYWDNKEHCLESAKKHKTITSWTNVDYGAWEHAKKNSWFDECTKHMNTSRKPAGYWTVKEHCLESARKYDGVKKWYKADYGAWENAKKYGWDDECTTHMKLRSIRGYWTKKLCLKKGRTYNSKKEWWNDHPVSASIAKKKGWMKECSAHMVEIYIRWTKAQCFEESNKHNRKTDWLSSSPNSYNAAKRKGWFDECTKHMK